MKNLYKFIISAFVVVGMGGCIPMIYPTSHTYEGYFLPAQPQVYDDLNDEFEEECQDVSEFINEESKGQNLKQYLIDRGADCSITDNICYFYFVREPQNNNQYISNIQVNEFNLKNRIYRNLFLLSFEIPFKITIKKAIKANFTKHIMGGCGKKISISKQTNIKTKLKHKVEGIINENQ